MILSSRGRKGRQPFQRGEAGDERAPEGDHRHEGLGTTRDGRQGPTVPALRVEGRERRAQPPRLVPGQAQQRFELGDRIGWQILAGGTARVAHPAEALG